MMRKIVSLVMLMTAVLLGTCVEAQTVKYRLVKIVDRNTEVEYSPSDYTPNRVVYVTFSGYNKGQFVFTSQNGQYDNSAMSWSYTGIEPKAVRKFSYTGTRNENKVYENKRPIYGMSGYSLISPPVLVGHITDYVYFNDDMSRFNVYSGGTASENGLSGYPNNSELFTPSNNVYVYERVDSKPSPTGLY